VLEVNKIYQGDCLELMKEIDDGSIDVIITDPPYGTVKGLGGDIEKYKHLSNSNWDVTLNSKDMFRECERVLRENGRLILFSQEPYTSRLIIEAHNNLPFNYRLVWIKDHFANCLVVNKAPVSYFEDIIVFTKKYDTLNLNPLRKYAKKVMDYIGLNIKQINKKLGHRKAEHFFYINTMQFGICTEETYSELVKVFDLIEMEGLLKFKDLKIMNQKSEAVFNLQEGKKVKSNVLNHKKDYGGLHPTQKPVSLIGDLIKTYSNEGNVVLDFTMGSGTTVIACLNTNRKFMGMELDEGYFEVAFKRIVEHKNNLEKNKIQTKLNEVKPNSSHD